MIENNPKINTFTALIKHEISAVLKNKYFEIGIIILITLNLLVFIFQTDVKINEHFSILFDKIEMISIAIFTVEYFMRLLTLKKIKDIYSFYMIIDLLAIAPYYLSFVTINTIFLRTLRLFRLFRIMKITRYSNAIINIKNAFVKRKNELLITA